MKTSQAEHHLQASVPWQVKTGDSHDSYAAHIYSKFMLLLYILEYVHMHFYVQ